MSCNRSRMLDPGRAGTGYCATTCALRATTPTMIGAFWLLVKALFFFASEREYRLIVWLPADKYFCLCWCNVHPLVAHINLLWYPLIFSISTT
jgi:hypothetical protein